MSYSNIADQKAYAKKHYQLHKAEYKRRSRLSNDKYRQRNMLFVARYKCWVGCKLCKFKEHEAALDFHHLDPNQKEIDVARLARNSVSLESLKTEIRKCIVLCATCHRLVHVGVRTVA